MSFAQTDNGVLKISLIDIAAFKAGTQEQRRAIAAEVDRAASEIGFMQISGHGIPDSAIKGLTDAIDGFFSLPLKQKLATRPPAVDINRGYTGPMSERLSYSLGVESAADLFEAFNIGSAVSDFPGVTLPISHYPENIWPALPATFRPQVEEWFAQAGRLARIMTEIFAVALGLTESYFVPFQNRSVDTMRLNHYQLPPRRSAAGAWPDGHGRPHRLRHRHRTLGRCSATRLADHG